MSKERIILSFLKEQKVKYFLDKDNNKVVFPCLTCNDDARMETSTTSWTCECCGTSGNLSTLIKMSEEDKRKMKRRNIYNPARALKTIYLLVDRVEEKGLNKEALELKEMICELVDYYKKSS